MKKTKLSFIFLLGVFSFSCNSDIEEFADDEEKGKVKEYIYSKDPNVTYANNKAETAFSNYGEVIELANGMFVKKINEDTYIFDLDMLLTKEQVKELEAYNEINPEPRGGLRGSVSQSAKTWPGGRVYYTFNGNVTPEFKVEIEAAINEWRNQSQLNFSNTTSRGDYIEFILGEDGSYSNVGCIGGRQYIHLDKHWADRGTAMHEIGHAVGLIHEHQSYIFHDRQNQLVFKWDNINDDYKDQFAKYNKAHDTYSAGVDDPNYPLNSLMIYGSFADEPVSKNPSQPVITFLLGGMFGGGMEITYRAQRSYLSISDRLAVARKYGYSYNPATDGNKPPI